MKPTTQTLALAILILASLVAAAFGLTAATGIFNTLSLIILAIPQRRTPRHLFD